MEPTANQRDALGKFQPGNKLARGGVRPNSGRKKKEVVAAAILASEVFKRTVEGNSEKIANHFVKRIFESDHVLTKAVDKLWPDEHQDQQSNVTNIAFIQFNHNTAQLHAPAVPAPILASDGNGHQAGGIGVAPASWQGQDGAELHDFEDVS